MLWNEAEVILSLEYLAKSLCATAAIIGRGSAGSLERLINSFCRRRGRTAGCSLASSRAISPAPKQTKNKPHAGRCLRPKPCLERAEFLRLFGLVSVWGWNYRCFESQLANRLGLGCPLLSTATPDKSKKGSATPIGKSSYSPPPAFGYLPTCEAISNRSGLPGFWRGGSQKSNKGGAHR